MLLSVHEDEHLSDSDGSLILNVGASFSVFTWIEMLWLVDWGNSLPRVRKDMMLVVKILVGGSSSETVLGSSLLIGILVVLHPLSNSISLSSISVIVLRVDVNS